MLVSFIIIAYNAEKFLDKSLESLKKQDYPHKDIEVILVDSISTDGTRKVFEEFKKENENWVCDETKDYELNENTYKQRKNFT